MPQVVLESDAMEVRVLPDYGARVVSLFDKSSGREWLQQGATSNNTGEDATYGGSEAIGWDECFPTVGACDANDTNWRRRLRGHGDLWGRRWTVDHTSANAVASNYTGPGYTFARELIVDGPILTARYSVASQASEALPYLWALHGLLLANDSDKILLPETSAVDATYVSLMGGVLRAPRQAWPKGDGTLRFALDEIQSPSTNFAAKFYARNIASRRAALGHPGEWLVVEWDRAINDLGLWINYGGWPSFPGGYHVALEPTTASADNLSRAIATNSAAVLAPGATHSWTVTLSFRKDLP